MNKISNEDYAKMRQIACTIRGALNDMASEMLQSELDISRGLAEKHIVLSILNGTIVSGFDQLRRFAPDIESFRKAAFESIETYIDNWEDYNGMDKS